MYQIDFKRFIALHAEFTDKQLDFSAQRRIGSKPHIGSQVHLYNQGPDFNTDPGERDLHEHTFDNFSGLNAADCRPGRMIAALPT
jgi:hypothetical protein